MDPVRASSLLPSIVGLALAASPAQAGGRVDVAIELNQTGRDLATELGIELPDLERRLADGITRGLALVDLDGFLESFANASGFSNRGVGVDYASNSDNVIVGLAGNLAVAAELGDGSPTAGVAANLTLMAGVNLDRWDHPQWTIYANVFHRGGGSGQLDGSISSAGVHVQRKFFHPTRGLKRLVVQWGGFDVTGGIELARWSFGIGDEIATDFELEGEGGAVRTITATTAGSFDLSTLTVTAPVEATTSLRLLYLLSIYTGVGLDLQVGRSRLDASLSGGLTAAAGEGAPETIGAVALQATGTHGPSVAGVHALLGLQANIWKLKLFTQLSYRPTTTASVAFGVRLDL